LKNKLHEEELRSTKLLKDLTEKQEECKNYCELVAKAEMTFSNIMNPLKDGPETVN